MSNKSREEISLLVHRTARECTQIIIRAVSEFSDNGSKILVAGRIVHRLFLWAYKPQYDICADRIMNEHNEQIEEKERK